MQETTTVSVKVTKEERAKMRKLGVSPSKVLREAIQHAIKVKLAERLDKRLNRIKKDLDKISEKEITDIIREDRDLR